MYVNFVMYLIDTRLCFTCHIYIIEWSVIFQEQKCGGNDIISLTRILKVGDNIGHYPCLIIMYSKAPHIRRPLSPNEMRY